MDYSILNDSVPIFPYFAPVFICLTVALIMFYFGWVYPKKRDLKLLIFGGLWGLCSFIFIRFYFSERSELKKYQALYQKAKFKTVTGKVTEYHPIRFGVKGIEYFVIDGKRKFQYPAKGYDYIGYDITKGDGSDIGIGKEIEVDYLHGRILALRYLEKGKK